MSSMAVAAVQKAATPSFSPYGSATSMAGRIPLTADSGLSSSHVVAGNSSHRQGQQTPINSLSRGVSLVSNATSAQNATRGAARSSVQVADPQFVQNEYVKAANAFLQQQIEVDQQSYGGSQSGLEAEHSQYFPPPNFADSFGQPFDFGMDRMTGPPPVNSRYFAPFPSQHPAGPFRNETAFRGDAAGLRDDRMLESYARMMALRRDQELDRPSTSFDRSSAGYDRSSSAYDRQPAAYDQRQFEFEQRAPSSFFSNDVPPADAFASLAARLNNASRSHNQGFERRLFTAAEPPSRSQHSSRNSQPFNAALAGIVDTLEKSLAISPPAERLPDWGFSPRTPQYRYEDEMRAKSNKGFEGFRDLDEVLPNGRQVDPTRVMVSGISWQMSAHQIRDELVHRCSKLGKVVDIEVAQYRGNSPSQLDRGRHRGFAFVTMDTPEQASLVMAALHKMDMGGMQVQTKPGVVKDPMFARRNYAKKKAEEPVHKPVGRKPVKVFVGNLWFGTDGERLREAFQDCGLIIDTKVVRDKDSGESRGFGFVTFANEAAAIEAIGARDGALLDGRKLVVNISRSWAGSNGEEESGSEGVPSEFAHERF